MKNKDNHRIIFLNEVNRFTNTLSRKLKKISQKMLTEKIHDDGKLHYDKGKFENIDVPYLAIDFCIKHLGNLVKEYERVVEEKEDELNEEKEEDDG
ncbi:MAG TPA: hypothetical protein ENI76_06350 [Ignavibacteria bacterium]|nr:hypothetical protein [Ignavibacteria bacterium]